MRHFRGAPKRASATAAAGTPLRQGGHSGGKAAAGRGSPKRKAIAMTHELREASWSAPVLWRFGKGRGLSRRRRRRRRTGRAEVKHRRKCNAGGNGRARRGMDGKAVSEGH